MELANSLLPTLLLLPISDAKHGTGTTKSVLPALNTGFSTPKTSVSQFLTTALLMMLQVLALLASRATTSLMELANSLLPTLLLLLMLDAKHGTGTTKSASPALNTGFSMLTIFVSQFLINARLMMLQVLALLVTRVMIL